MTITFQISSEDNLLIKKDQDVDFKTPLTKQVYTKDAKINLAQKMQITPQNIFIHLTKVVGDEIQMGEVLAKKKSLLGEKKYTSEYSGVIKAIDHTEGSVLISTKTKQEKIKYAFFKGKVGEIKKNEVTLNVKKAKTYPLKEVSSDFGGEVLFVGESSLERLTEEEVENKVLFINSLKSFNRVKFEVMGLLGFIMVQELNGDTTVPHASLKSAEDLDEIKEVDYPYCLVSKKNNLIYLYQ